MATSWWFWIGAGYLCGSIPFGLLIGLAKGVDVRKSGSGNIGATNVGRVLGKWWGVMCFVLAFLLLNLEIADFFSPVEGTLTFEFSGNLARDMTYTIAWALFAFALLVLGIWRRLRFVRYAALGLLSVALLKLFLHDLANLDNLYRIGALIAVAAIAIVASFVYQRFLPANHEPANPPAPLSPAP